MSAATLITNGTVVTADGEFAGDVLVDGETIAAVGRVTAPEGARSSTPPGVTCCPG